jgi:hypothetical protein
MNNLSVRTVLSPWFNDAFGFTEPEVKEMLSFYNLDEHFETIKKWYDGYFVAGAEIYNPWSICSYVRDNSKMKTFPKTYWVYTASNKILKELFFRYGKSLKTAFQDLLDDKTIKSQINENLTYDNMYNSPENLWSFLLFTGYLKSVAQDEERKYELKIPNLEIRDLFREIFQEYFKNRIVPKHYAKLFEYIKNDECDSMSTVISNILDETISYWDLSAEG